MVDIKSVNISFSCLHKRLGRKIILRDASLLIRSGELNLIRGKNGTGKTTLLRIIAGLEKPDSATIDSGNGATSWRRSRKQLRNLSVYLHQHAYMLDGSVKENLAYTLSQRKLTKKEKDHLIDTALELTQINDISDYYAKSLSGGEQQRVALARAWLRQPKIMLLDEPTANMDQDARTRTIELLDNLKAQGLALFVASHDPEQFSRLAENTLTLSDGTLSATNMNAFKPPRLISIQAA